MFSVSIAFFPFTTFRGSDGRQDYHLSEEMDVACPTPHCFRQNCMSWIIKGMQNSPLIYLFLTLLLYLYEENWATTEASREDLVPLDNIAYSQIPSHISLSQLASLLSLDSEARFNRHFFHFLLNSPIYSSSYASPPGSTNALKESITSDQQEFLKQILFIGHNIRWHCLEDRK